MLPEIEITHRNDCRAPLPGRVLVILMEVPHMAANTKKELMTGDVKEFIKSMATQKEEKRKSPPTMRSQKAHHKLST